MARVVRRTRGNSGVYGQHEPTAGRDEGALVGTRSDATRGTSTGNLTLKLHTIAPLVEALAKRNGVRPQTVRNLIADITEELCAAVLTRGETVQFPHFGTLYPKTRKSRRLRDIQTKALVMISGNVAVGFRSAAKAKKLAP